MKRLFWWFKYFLKKIYIFFSGKNRIIKNQMKPHCKKCIEYLKSINGIQKIKPVFVDTWKYYGYDHVRFSYFVRINSKNYIAKFVKGWDEKTNNGIKVFEKYSTLFDFVPKGQKRIFLDYVINFNDYIDSFTFDKARLFCNVKCFNDIIAQLCDILDSLNKYKIVHCDIDDTNILIQKKTFKVFIVDFDTSNSSILDLQNNLFPTHAIRQEFERYDIYDDAWAIKQLLDKVTFLDVRLLPSYSELVKRIGRNTFTVKK